MKKYQYYLTLIILYLGFSFSHNSCKEKEERKAAPPEIQVVEIIQQDVPLYREFVGQTYGLLDIPIRARVDGFLEEISFGEGTSVTKGQLLYRIDSQPYMAEVAAQKSKVAEAQTYLVNATNELARYKPLAEINAVSKSDLDAAQASKDAAEAALQAAEANLKLAEINFSYTRIKSPINGLIGKTNARVGEYVGKSPNPVILNTVSNIEHIRIQFFLTETQYIALVREFPPAAKRSIQPVNEREERANVELILADGSLYSEKGHIDFIDRNVDPTTGSMLVQASFENPDRILRPGMFARVKIQMGTAEGALLIPQRAVMELQGQNSVYIVDSENKAQARQIIATEKIGDLWMIEEGLNPGEKVVIDGLQKVVSGLQVNPKLVEFKSEINQ